MARVLARLVREERGQDLIEYGLLAALISLIAIVAIANIGSLLAASYADLTAAIP